MQREQFKSSVKAMFNNSASDIDSLIEKAMNCGAIDIAAQDENDFTTRKALVHVIALTIADNWMPLTTEGKKEVKNLKRFV